MDSHDDIDCDDDSVVQRNVARTTASGIEMLMLYLETEARRIRLFLRAFGGRLRRFFVKTLRIDFRNIVLFLSDFTTRRMKHASLEMPELNDVEAMIFNAVPMRSSWKLPKYTFNDTATVLTVDEEVEDGVIHAYMIRSPAWNCLPSPVSSRYEPELVDFQSFNHPLKKAFTVDDEDERLSLPSTMMTDQDLKIQSLEAQLELLSKQMQTLLAGRIPPVVPVAANFDTTVSDDEGKGASLSSPTEITKPTFVCEGKQACALANPSSLTCPHPPPPPPPPLSLLLVKSTSTLPLQKVKTKPDALQMLKQSTNLEHDVLPVRPSADDLKMVQLKKQILLGRLVGHLSCGTLNSQKTRVTTWQTHFVKSFVLSRNTYLNTKKM
ncbi:hypothetical protein KIN20_024037 [Parelaphostrongylus tenuis]|uniref:Uncharacterized protein n=1 Tax=Parelaphostrongylus tenuis TaxID=148309 RepID=A0AAD5QVP9_PARTN|nr:hypothetical protein KIN20_024037 [Parelaphostrongylus tenuis]